VSHDYWGSERSSRERARFFRKRLSDLGVFVAFTMTHVIELLRHGNEELVRDRLRFLRSIPLIAWLRPYDRAWIPGAIGDLLCRELHVVVYGSARDWPGIVADARPELWETGVGSEMFVENEEFWSRIRRESSHQHEIEKYVASVARTDAGHMMDLKLSDVLRLPRRPKEEWGAYKRRFTAEMQRQLDRHGDKRLDISQEVAIDFANSTLERVRAIEEMGENVVQLLLGSFDVPAEFVSPEMTIGEVGELGVYAKQLKVIAKGLRPPIELAMRDVPPETLPSCVLERELSKIQRTAKRVSGSDLGDAHIAPLILYADGVEVDRRTSEYLTQVRRNEPSLASLMGRFFSCSHYSEIPNLLAE